MRCSGRRGGIGRRAGLKIPWWRHRTGSTPVAGTTFPADRRTITLRNNRIPFPSAGIPVGAWRSLVARLTGGQKAASSNLVAPTTKKPPDRNGPGVFLFAFFYSIDTITVPFWNMTVTDLEPFLASYIWMPIMFISWASFV